jgi:hypothetical protein
MPATTIGEVIGQLDAMVRWARTQGSRLGYFAALYREVTRRVKARIEEGFFEDGRRMERLDVAFAHRYFEAFEQSRAGRTPTRSWQVAFEASTRWWPIVLQHLLLGMNAHINLDLGIAAARAFPGAAIRGLEEDFRKINEILVAMIDEVENRLAEVWPLLKLLDHLAGRSEETVLGFSLRGARALAWTVATDLAVLDDRAQESRIAELDRIVAALGEGILHPGVLAGTTVRVVRMAERRRVEEVIDLLAGLGKQ